MPKHYNVLFLCTGNSARSIMAEALLNAKGKPTFTAFSAGSHPSGKVRPEALTPLQIAHIPIEGLRSKSWDEFTQPGAPALDFVITVCDNAANEVCPIFHVNVALVRTGEDERGVAPVKAHWGIPDPAAVQGSDPEIESAFRNAFTLLERRIALFLKLPLGSIDKLALQTQLDQIGREP